MSKSSVVGVTVKHKFTQGQQIYIISDNGHVMIRWVSKAPHLVGRCWMIELNDAGMLDLGEMGVPGYGTGYKRVYNSSDEAHKAIPGFKEEQKRVERIRKDFKQRING